MIHTLSYCTVAASPSPLTIAGGQAHRCRGEGARKERRWGRGVPGVTLSLSSLNAVTAFFRGEPVPAAAPPAVEVTAGDSPTAAKDALAMIALACAARVSLEGEQVWGKQV